MSTRPLPLHDGTTAARIDLGSDLDHGDACITCGDVALVLTVVSIDGSDARCRDEATGAEETVAVDLVGPLRPGDRVLVHARVALERLDDAGPRTKTEG